MTTFRGDYLLRACVEAIQAAGYRVVQRESTADCTRILLRAGTCSARLTHHWRRRCLTVELPSSRTVRRYYQVYAPADLARLAGAIAGTLQPPDSRAS